MVLKLKQMRQLPFSTLKTMAMQVAADIDNGEDDKRDLLVSIFDAIKTARDHRWSDTHA